MLEVTSLLITDTTENLSKKVDFSKKTLITSDKNSKGKSIIMKSIYHALGANSQYDDPFEHRSKIYDIHFKINSLNYRIIRFKDDYVVFKNDKVIKKIRRNIVELSQFLKEETDNYVYLKDRNSDKLVLAPPAISYIPYYLDQDNSWKKDIKPFRNLDQFAKLSRDELFYYHLGVYDEYYGKGKNVVTEIKNKISELEEEVNVLDQTYTDLQKILGTDTVIENEEEMNQKIRIYKKQIDEKLKKVEKTRNTLYSIQNDTIVKTQQLNQVESLLKELEKTNCTDGAVFCPKCGEDITDTLNAEIEKQYNKNYLVTRQKDIQYEILEYGNQVIELKSKLSHEIDELNSLDKNFKESNSMFEEYLNKKASINLYNELIEDMSKKTYEIREKKLKLEEVTSNILSYRTKKMEVNKKFKELYIESLRSLNVTNFRSSNIKNFKKANIGGSQYVRSTLAFFFSFIATKKNLELNRFMYPLLIDSPREGEQDMDNSHDILDFIMKKNIEDYQIIIASVSADEYIDFNEYPDWKIVKLDNQEYHLLQKSEYDENIIAIDEAKQLFNI